MDEEVVNDLYNQVVSKGYKKSLNDFIKLLHSDQEVFNDMYSYVKGKGYSKSTDDFALLVGKTSGQVITPKKKGESMVSDSEVSSSVLPSGDGSYVKELTKKDKFTQVPFEKRTIPEVTFETENKTREKEEAQKRAATLQRKPYTDEEIEDGKQKLKAFEQEYTPKEPGIGGIYFTMPEVKSESTRVEKPIDIKTEKEKEKQRIILEEQQKKRQEVKDLENWRQSNIKRDEAVKLEKEKRDSALYRSLTDIELSISLLSVNKDLIDKDQNTAIKELTNEFGKYGFNFKPGGEWLGHSLIVSTDDGKNSIPIDLKPGSDKLKESESLKLRNFISNYNIVPETKKSFIDQEGENFYKERNRDYYTEKRRWERYNELNDIIGFFEGYSKKGKEKIEQQYPDLFYKGDPIWNIGEKIQEYKKELETLRPLLKDDTFFSQSNTAERTREDFDSYLAKKENEIIKSAAEVNKQAKIQEDAISEESRRLFNMDIQDLIFYKSDNPEYQKEIDNLINQFVDAQDTRKGAAARYEFAKLYYNEKVNKDINGDLTDNFVALWNTIGDNYKQGLVNDQLLALAMPGMYIPYSGTTDLKEASEYIINKLNSQSGTQSRVETRLQNAKTRQDYIDVMLDNPLESMVIAAAGSLSLMLPTGFKIIPAFTAGGAATGSFVPGVGTVLGAGKGFEVGQAVNSYALEYTSAIMEAVENSGYNPMDPESLAAGLADERVWKNATDQSLARGIPIALADYMSSKLTGRVFKPSSKLDGLGKRIALGTAERVIVDPALEAAGEALAQSSEIFFGTGRGELDIKEIIAEGRGALGSKLPNMIGKLYYNAKTETNAGLASNLTKIHNVGIATESDEKISNWANNMQQLGKIDADVNQRIQENVGLRRDAKELLNIGTTEKKSEGPVVSRVMELLSAKKELSATKNRQEVYAEKIKEINNELATISQTKQLLPDDKKTNLDGIIEARREDVSEYKINGVVYNKDKFLSKLNSMSSNRLMNATIGIKGDEETSKLLKDKVDAIQKQAAGEVPVQPEARVGEEVVQGKPETGLEVTSEQVVLSPEEKERKGQLEKAEINEEKNTAFIPETGELLEMDEYKNELETLTKKEQVQVTPEAEAKVEEVVKEEAPAEVTPAPKTTTDIITSAPIEIKGGVVVTDSNGNDVMVNGNEQVAAKLYDEAIAIPEEQRTPNQNDIVEKVQRIISQVSAEVTPAEVTPAEVTPVEKTPEQEADLLEELLTGKKKEPAMTPQVETMTLGEEVMTPEAKAEEVKLAQDITIEEEKAVTPEAKAEEEMIVSETKSKEPEVYVPKDENIGSKEYRAKAPNHVTGRTRERTIADGTKIKGRYKLVSANEVLASHNEETFGKTEGFPVNEQGKTVNDRDYETDKAAQSEVVRIAGKLDERALSQTPIVTKDGIVVDGNNRTMSRKLAAKQGTDAAYVEALRQDADMYGIDPNEIDNVENPMLVFEAEQEIPYTTKEFSRFNKAEKKEKSPIEKAVELSKTITDRFRRMLGSIYDKAKNPSDVTSSASTMSEIRDLLLAEGILQPNELPRYINPETGTATKEGVAFLETLLIGSALSENTIRTLDNDGMGNAKRRIIEAVVQITKNAGLGANSLQKNIENGIKLLGKAIATNQSVTDVIRQMDLFEISEFSAEDLAIAVLLDGDGFKKFLQKYNSEVGTEGFFGSITKEGLIDELLNNKIKGYEQIRKNLRSDVETGQAKVQTGDGGVKPKGEGKQGDTGKGKKLSDAVKNLKIKGPDGLQSNIFGVPIAIWNAAMDTVAAAIDAGVAVAEAIQRGADYISENYKTRWQKAQYENRVLDAIYTNAINLARENGITDDGIKRYLERKGLTTEQIDKLIKKRVPKEKKPPTAEDIVGKPKPKKVTVNEMAALKDQIRLEARAAREAKGDLNSKRKALAEAINKLVAKGTITLRQANAIIKRVNLVNLDNPIMVDRLINYVGNIFNDADYDTKMQEVRKLQNQVKRKNHTSTESTVREFTSINPELIPDNKILQYIQALDDMNTGTPSYAKMNDMFDEVMSYKTEPEGFNAIKTFQKLMDKLESIALNEVKSVEDYVNLIRDINAFKRNARKLLENGSITQKEYDEVIENVGKDQAAVEKKYEKELAALKKDLVSEIEKLRPKTNPDFTAEENAMIEKYLEIGKDKKDESYLMKLAPEELYILNDLLQNIKDGQMDYYRFADIVSKAYSKDAIQKTTEQVKKSKFNMALDKGKELLSEYESSFWEGLLGLGRVTSGALQKFIVSPVMRAIASYEKFVQDSYKEFSILKKKYGINTKEKMNKLGMLTTYLQEYMAQFDPDNEGVKDIGKRDWFKEILNSNKMKEQYPSEKFTARRVLGKLVGGGKTQLESMQKIWNSLPKDKDGNVDPKAVYDSYMANDGKFFSNKEKEFFDKVMEWKQKNTTTKQKAANELRGNPFKEMPFHMLRSRYDSDAKQIAPKASGANGMVRIEAGTGKEIKNKNVGPININFEELFIEGIEQTARDYFLSGAIQDVNNVLSGVSANMGENQTIVNTITGAISEALNFEFEKSSNILGNILSARATMVLLDAERTVRETLAGLVSYPIRAKTISGYKDLFRSVKKMKDLLEFTQSPLRLRENIGSSLEISDGQIQKMNALQRWTFYLAGLPERTMMVTSWMPTFRSEFKNITGSDFNMEAFKTDKAYKEKFGKAIREASAVADAQTEKIIGTTAKAGQRRNIRIAPEFLANLVGLKGTVKKNTAAGQIIGFFTNYPYREVTEFFNGFREAAEIIRNKGFASSPEAAAQLSKPLGIIINVAVYGYLASMSYALQLMTLGDEDDEERGKTLFDEMTTTKGILEDFQGNAISLLASRYGIGSKALLQIGGTVAYVMEEDAEKKKMIKKFMKGSIYVDPLPIEKATQYGGKEAVAASIASYIPQLIVLADRLVDASQLIEDASKIYNKAEKDGVDSLTEKQQIQVLVGSALFKGTQLALNFAGTSLPFYGKLKIYEKKLRTEAGIAEKTKSSEKREAYGGFKTIEELEIADPKKYKELSKKGGALYEFRQKEKAQRKVSEEKKAKEYEEKYGVKPKPKKGGSREGTGRDGNRGVDRGSDRGGGR